MSTELTGKVEGVVFSNRQTGFHVLKVRPDGDHKAVSVSGGFPGQSLGVGLKVKLIGEWTEHPKFGKQFSAAQCEVVPEPGRSGIVTYLQTNVPSIGPLTAMKLYDALGEELIGALEKDHDKIRELPFLTKTQASEIIKEWSIASETRTAAIFLADLGLNSAQIKSVYTRFGNSTKSVVAANPYVLYECPGVGFSTADSAALRMGVGRDDMRRVRAFLLFCITDLCGAEGHMYCTSDQVRDHVRKIFKYQSVEPFSYGEYVADSMFYEGLHLLEEASNIIRVDGRIYLRNSWEHESEAAKCIAAMARHEPRELGDVNAILTEFESLRKVQLSKEQREAFLMLEKSRVCVVSGFPGTGKTLLISAFVHLLEKNNLHYVLMSPTGIAAKRLSQVTGKPASTIHRALCFQKDGTWEFHSTNKFHADAVIVDEMSMVDGATFYHLISSLPDTTMVIMVGDPAQLPSVGAGYVLNNLMKSGSVPHVALTRIYRQERESAIVKVAHAIQRGERVDTGFDKTSEFVFITLPLDRVLEDLCTFASKLKDRGANFQVIAPTYAGDLGVNNLNRKLREVLNPDFASGKASKLARTGQRPGKGGEIDFYEGDRVMLIKNDYDRMTFNGDVGKIQRISPKEDEVDVKVFDWFDHDSPVPRYVDKVFTYKLDEARQVLRVAYACTAHKIQGQEFDYVLMPMTMQYGVMLYRNLVYTSITRARHKAVVFGDPTAFHYAVGNDRETVRNSFLGALIGEEVARQEDPAMLEDQQAVISVHDGDSTPNIV